MRSEFNLKPAGSGSEWPGLSFRNRSFSLRFRSWPAKQRYSRFLTNKPLPYLVPPSASLDPHITPILALLIASVARVQASFSFLSIFAANRLNVRQAELRETIDGWIKDHAVPREFYDGWQNSGCKGRRLNDALGAAASWAIPLTLVAPDQCLLLYTTWSGFNVRTDAFSQWITNVK